MSSEASELPQTPDAAGKPKKRRRWKRIFIGLLIALVIIAIAGRVTINYALPPVLRKVAGKYGFDASYDRMELYLLGGDVGIWGFRLTPKSGGEPVMQSEYCRADVSALNLLRGRLVVRRIEADGVSLLIDRQSDGDIPLLRQVMAAQPSAPAVANSTAAKPSDLSLDAPLRIDQLRVSRLRARWRDRAVNPPLDTTMNMTMRLNDLGSSARPTHFLLDITSEPVLDSLEVEGNGTSRNGKLDADMSITVRGLHPKPAAGYLVALGLRPSADNISMKMSGSMHLATKRAPPGAAAPAHPIIAGTIALSGISASADGIESAGLDHLNLDIDAMNTKAVRLAKLTIDGARANALRRRDGVIHLAGFDLVPAKSAVPAKVVGAPAAQLPPASAPTAASPLPDWSLGQLLVRNVAASLHDDACTPATDLAFHVNQFSIKDLDSTRPNVPTTIAGTFSAPGIASTIQLDGSVTPLASSKAATIHFNASGIRPDAIKPYLEAAGIQSELKNASLSCDVNAAETTSPDGKINAQAKLSNIKLTDDQTALFSFGGAELAGMKLDPSAHAMRIDSVEITGPQLDVHRDQQGTIHLLGFAIPRARATKSAGEVAQNQPSDSAIENESGAAAATSTAAAGAPAVLPQVEIGKLTWKGVQFRFDDAGVTPPTHIQLSDAGVEISDVNFDLNPGDPPAAPGKIHAWLAAPGLAKSLVANGTVRPSAGAVAIDLDVAGQGLDATAAAPYLQSAGIIPVLNDGALRLHAKISAAQTNTGFAGGVALENVKFSQGNHELLGLDAMKIADIRAQNHSISIGDLELVRPRADVERQADGSLLLAGVRIPAAVPAPASSVDNTQNQAAVPSTAPAAAASSAPASSAPPAMIVDLQKFGITNGALGWSDRAVSPPVQTTARATMALNDLVVGRQAPPAHLTVSASLDQTISKLTSEGTVSLAPNSPAAKLEFSLEGFRAGALAPYLPTGTKLTLADGRIHGNLDAALSSNSQGGSSAHLIVSGLDYRDGTTPLASFDSAKAIIGRADLAGRIVDVKEISLAGLQASADKAADGSLHLLGLSISTPPPASRARPVARARDASSKSITPAPSAPLSTASAKPVDVNAMIAQRRQKLPLISLDKLDLNVKRFAFSDQSHPGGEPITLSNLRLWNPRRIELLGDDYASRPPVELDLTGKVDPLADHLAIQTQLSPFASQPSLHVAINISGIRGEGIVAVAPQLRQSLDGAQMSDGDLRATFEAAAKVVRRSPTQIDLDRPVDATFSLSKVQFRAKPQGPVLAGLDEINGNGVHFDPSTGNVTIASLEIDRPILHAWRDESGIHALGMTIKPPATQPSAGAQSTPAAKDVSAEGSQNPPPPAPAGKPASEYRIDKLIVSGCDVSIEDRTCKPPLEIPITGLEVDARGLSNMCLFEKRPVRFTATVSAGKVPLVTGKSDDLFSEIAASGNLSLYPRPDGWAKTSVSGFDLLSLYGPAKARQVNIGGGTFDSGVDLRFDGNTIHSRSKFVFTDLKVDEPPDGIIRQTLRLPTPLDTVILVLQDASGAITVPLNLQIDQNKGVGGGQIAGQAVGAFLNILATATASAPLKVTSGVTQMVGLGNLPVLGGKRPAGPQPAGQILFQPGAADPSAVSLEIRSLIDQLQKDHKLEVSLSHDLGGGDITREAERANPGPADAAALAGQLREQRERIISRRMLAAQQARAVLASDPSSAEASSALARVRDLDRQLALTEQSFDGMYDLLRPGADRQATRRTRSASLALAQVRLDEVRSAIVRAGIDPARVRIIHPKFAEATGDAGGRISMTLVPMAKP